MLSFVIGSPGWNGERDVGNRAESFTGVDMNDDPASPEKGALMDAAANSRVPTIGGVLHDEDSGGDVGLERASWKKLVIVDSIWCWVDGNVFWLLIFIGFV